MTRNEILSDFWQDAVKPVLWIVLSFVITSKVIYAIDPKNSFIIPFVASIPFGVAFILRRFIVGGTGWFWFLFLIVGGFIGIFIVAWQIMVSMWYTVVAIYRLIKMANFRELFKSDALEADKNIQAKD